MHLERLPRLTRRFLPPTAPLCICFVFHTFGCSTGNSPSYRTTLVQSTRFASPFSVQPMAVTMLCPVALDFMPQKAPVGTQLCAKSRESPAPPYHLPRHDDDDGDNHHDMFTWPYVYSDLAHTMFGVAGGNCPSKCHCNRIRGERYRGKRFTARLVTLP